MSQETKQTTCALDCPDNCALLVDVVDGKATRIYGEESHPMTRGFICGKVRRMDRRVYHRDRLQWPMKRIGAKGEGRFQRIDWDEAIATIAERFTAIRRQWGGEAILPCHYGGSNGLLSDEFLDALFFARLGASRQLKTVCAVPTSKAVTHLYGKMPGVAAEDYPHAAFILVWGANPKASQIHLVPFLKEAKKRGSFIATVDPMNHFSDRETDLHLGLSPGTDLPLALALIHHWRERGLLDEAFLAEHAVNAEPLLAQAANWPVARAAEVCRIEPEAIRSLAERYAAASPAVLRCGWGLERNSNGGQAAAAVLALPAMLGKFGLRGGGYTMSNGGAAKFDAEKILGKLEWRTREINQSELGAALLRLNDPPIKGLFVFNANPAVTFPDQNAILQGLTREDLFTVVSEQVMTDTAVYADVLLPATTFLEAYDLRKSYGSYTVGGTAPTIAPVGESRSNAAVFSALGRAMGFDDAAFKRDDATLLRRIAETLVLTDGPADADRIVAGGWQRNTFAGDTPIQFGNVFPGTANGKVDLTPAMLGTEPYRFHSLERDGYPLALITPASEKLITSTFGEFNLDRLIATIHPEAAAQRGLRQGGRARVFNDLGEVVCDVHITDRIARDTVMMPKGAWRKSSHNGFTATALCPATVNVVGGAACYNDARVEMTPAD